MLDHTQIYEAAMSWFDTNVGLTIDQFSPFPLEGVEVVRAEVLPPPTYDGSTVLELREVSTGEAVTLLFAPA